MKHFTIRGPKTTRDFDIEDHQIIQWKIINIREFESNIEGPLEYYGQNEVIKEND